MSDKKAARVIPIQPAGRSTSSAGALEFHTPLPLSLYVHIPWCVQKCPYCDFYSHQIREGLPETEYVTALVADLESALPLIWGRKIGSVFFGGSLGAGTAPAAKKGKGGSGGQSQGAKER